MPASCPPPATLPRSGAIGTRLAAQHGVGHQRGPPKVRICAWLQVAAVILALEEASTASSVEWWWLLDADAAITNWSIPVEEVVRGLPSSKLLVGSVNHISGNTAFHEGWPVDAQAGCSYYYPADAHGQRSLATLNTGSLLLRNSKTLQRFLVAALCAPLTPGRTVQLRAPPYAAAAATVWHRDDQVPLTLLLAETRPCLLHLLPQRILNSHVVVDTLSRLHEASCAQWRPGDLVMHAYGCQLIATRCKEVLQQLLMVAEQAAALAALPSPPAATAWRHRLPATSRWPFATTSTGCP